MRFGTRRGTAAGAALEAAGCRRASEGSSAGAGSGSTGSGAYSSIGSGAQVRIRRPWSVAFGEREWGSLVRSIPVGRLLINRFLPSRLLRRTVGL